ncbi:MAG TPA: hypothetical protein VFY84_18835 [Jiangellales bacterium]|nr:hypothetical protein [Jiangellales bacterium]
MARRNSLFSARSRLSSFAAPTSLPVVAFAEIGAAVPLGVLLDTIIVRSVLDTALNMMSDGGCVVAEQAIRESRTFPRSKLESNQERAPIS